MRSTAGSSAPLVEWGRVCDGVRGQCCVDGDGAGGGANGIRVPDAST
ncbi:MAG: hypothetical protein JWO86_364 [Myxococcaceae bacterium]|nr:hypothetical protein [Myxococcaceae bacterium]